MSGKPAVKIMAMLKRKAGLSMEEFIDYYENHHVPLIRRIVPYMQDYRRNYVRGGSSGRPKDGTGPDCDVITEAWFASREDFAKFKAEGLNAESREAITQDELKFLDRDFIRLFVVDER
jgi:uncharacterized protein (TIGR02118 family)